MYAPHFAAALAVKAHVRQAPTGGLLMGAFLPDLLWIVLARLGVEPADASNFFDDWSHSLVSIAVLATAFALYFWRRGRIVVLAIWLTVFSHFLLDFPVHPRRLALYPGSKVHLGWDLLEWGSRQGWLNIANDWWLQLAVLLALTMAYVHGMREGCVSMSLILACCLVLLSLHLLMLAPCLGY